jgi:hypothetical protein
LLTDVVTDAELFEVGLSVTPAGAVTVAVFVIELAVEAETVALTEIVAVPPNARLMIADTFPVPDAGAHTEGREAVQVQVAPVSPGGSVSATVAPTTSDGPLFVTTIVYEIELR